MKARCSSTAHWPWMVAVCCILLAAAHIARGQNPYADFVASYVSGTGLNTAYETSSVALGAPASSAVITAPAYSNTQIVGVGEGGELTVKFDTPITNAPADHEYGMDFTIFGNEFFVNGNSGIASIYNHPGLTVWVSQDDVKFYQLVAPDGQPHGADDMYPTEGSGNPLLPVNPALSLSDFENKTSTQALALYNGSAGGSSYSISWAENADGDAVDLPDISYIEVEGSSGYGYIDAFSRVENIPEPSAMALCLMAAAALLCTRPSPGRRRRAKGVPPGLLLAGAFVFAAQASTQAAVFTFSDIRYWVGTGTNESALVIAWNDGITPDSLVFGYKWDALPSGGDPTLYEMMASLQSADSYLEFTANPEYDDPGTGDYALYSAFYNLTGGAGPVVGSPYDLGGTENGYAPAGDHYREGWFTGFWGELLGNGNPFDGGSWEASDEGIAIDTLGDDSWFGLSFSRDETNFTIPDPEDPSALYPLPVPEPSAFWLLPTALAASCRRAWKPVALLISRPPP